MIGRRGFLRVVTLAGAPLLSGAQPLRQPTAEGKYRVVLRMIWGASFERQSNPGFIKALSRALADLGYVEGANLELVKHHLPDATPEGRKAMLAELTSSRVDAVVVVGGGDARRVRDATRTVPIVAWSISDPVGMGLAKSFTRPGGNLTGLTYGFREVIGKHLHFLRRLVPGLSGVVAFAGGMMRYDNILAEGAARAAGLRFKLYLDMKELGEDLPSLRERAFQAAITVGVGDRAKELAEMAARSGVAMVGVFDSDAEAGMLASYGEHYYDLVLRIAQMVAALLRGADPADTPFMEPTRFKFTLNRSTARALGLEIPPDLLVLADHVYG